VPHPWQARALAVADALNADEAMTLEKAVEAAKRLR